MSPYDVRNIRLFILFRLFFNARFYYPVFTILFLDFGLSLEQFALLNAAWAASIVLLEVPSGALADTIGRRNLLVAAGALMVVEMLLLCLAPRGHADLLFPVFLANRILSGAAEAAASGADEALAYDSLLQHGSAQGWTEVLEVQMRVQSIGYILAMTVGSAVYDPGLMQALSRFLGAEASLGQEDTLRLPLYLTLVMALLTLATAMRMTESRAAPAAAQGRLARCRVSAAAALRLTLQAGGWIVGTPFALALILTGLCFDHVLRMVITLGSEYYRLISLPEASFGLIGSGMALLGMAVPRMARWMAGRFPPAVNFWAMAGVSLAALAALARFVPILGLAPMAALFAVMYMVRFFQSHYLNRITPSEQRATVLSFKGLSYNLAYGLIGIGYSVLVGAMRSRAGGAGAPSGGQDLEAAVFMAAMAWFPVYFFLAAAGVALVAGLRLRKAAGQDRPG